MTALERSEALDRLVAQQAADDARRRLHPLIPGAVRESELELPSGDPGSLDRLAGDAPEPAVVLVLDEAIAEHERRPRPRGDRGQVHDAEGAARRHVAARIGYRTYGLGIVWTAAVVAWTPEAGPCPACASRVEGRGCCLVCSATDDNVRQHPMAGTPTRPAPRRHKGKAGQVLKGGVGGGTKIKPKGRPKRADPRADWQPSAL